MFDLYRPMLNLLDLDQEAVNFQTSYCLRVSNAVDAAYRKCYDFIDDNIFENLQFSCDHIMICYPVLLLFTFPEKSHDTPGDIQNGGPSNIKVSQTLSIV